MTIKTYDGKPYDPKTHDIDGVPKFSPMDAFLRQRMGSVHWDHMDSLNADPNGWPDPDAYKRVMKAARAKAIEEWLQAQPDGPKS